MDELAELVKSESQHKWKEDEDGKMCLKCGSRINNPNRFDRYEERSRRGGFIQGVNHYPRCFPIKK